jgi:hypothetical protein
MSSNPPSEKQQNENDLVVDRVNDALVSLDLKPTLIPSGRIDCLRGGLSCFELDNEEIDAAILLKQSRSRLFRIDYAVRGNVRGVLPGRIISETELRLKGVLRKKLEDFSWVTPTISEKVDEFRRRIEMSRGGVVPGSGELWEDGPHMRLSRVLNEDLELRAVYSRLIERKRSRFLSLSVWSDRWGESIRVSGDLWFETEELDSTYLNKDYTHLTSSICRHVKQLRRDFGGIAF